MGIAPGLGGLVCRAAWKTEATAGDVNAVLVHRDPTSCSNIFFILIA